MQKVRIIVHIICYARYTEGTHTGKGAKMRWTFLSQSFAPWICCCSALDGCTATSAAAPLRCSRPAARCWTPGRMPLTRAARRYMDSGCSGAPGSFCPGASGCRRRSLRWCSRSTAGSGKPPAEHRARKCAPYMSRHRRKRKHAPRRTLCRSRKRTGWRS